eukprot:2143216-Pleurochrysis_carterae.AAC.2
MRGRCAGQRQGARALSNCESEVKAAVSQWQLRACRAWVPPRSVRPALPEHAVARLAHALAAHTGKWRSVDEGEWVDSHLAKVHCKLPLEGGVRHAAEVELRGYRGGRGLDDANDSALN